MGDATFRLFTYDGEVAVERGPIGRFIDLAAQIEAEGLTVPAEIQAVLDQLQQPQEQES